MMHYQVKSEWTRKKSLLPKEEHPVVANIVVDMRSLSIMKSFKYPVVFDATHSLQMPSKEKNPAVGLN